MLIAYPQTMIRREAELCPEWTQCCPLLLWEQWRKQDSYKKKLNHISWRWWFHKQDAYRPSRSPQSGTSAGRTFTFCYHRIRVPVSHSDPTCTLLSSIQKLIESLFYLFVIIPFGANWPRNLSPVIMWLQTTTGFGAKAKRVCLEERWQQFFFGGDLIGKSMVVQLWEGIKMKQAGVFLLVP